MSSNFSFLPHIVPFDENVFPLIEIADTQNTRIWDTKARKRFNDMKSTAKK